MPYCEDHDPHMYFRSNAELTDHIAENHYEEPPAAEEPENVEAGAASEANPSDFHHRMPAKDQISAQLNEQMNKMLNEYSERVLPQLGKMMDAKIGNAINKMTEVLSGGAGNGKTADSAQESEEPEGPGDKIMAALGEYAPALLRKWLGPVGGAGGAAAPGSDFLAQFKAMADMMDVAKGTFVDTHQDSMRVGMKVAADAYTYAYRATGAVPDNVQFAASIDQAAKPDPVSTVAGDLSAVAALDLDAIVKKLVPKMTE